MTYASDAYGSGYNHFLCKGLIMGSLSNFGENALLNHLLNTAYTAPTTVYLTLNTADPTDAGTGASMSETANASGYARQAITFGVPSARRTTQSADISFPVATGNYGAAITHWAIVDALTYGTGNMLAHGAFASSFTPLTGNQPKVVTALQEVYVQFDASSGAGLSDYSANNLLNLMFRNQAFATKADSTYIALSNTVVDDQDIDAGDFTEVTGTDYARKLVSANGGSSPTWSTVSGGAASNAHTIDFGTVGAGGWTQVVAIVMIDSASGAGNVIGYDSANVVDQTPAANDTVSIPVGDFDISIT